MIDFLSTHDSTDLQTQRCLHLLSAVIAQAIKDASEPLSKEEKQQMKNLNDESLMAVRWLFGKHSTFPWFANAVGSNAPAMRKALLASREESIQKTPYTHMDALRLQRRYRMWCGTPDDSDKLEAMDEAPIGVAVTG